MPTTIEVLTLPNYLGANILEESELSADAAAAQAIINLLNANGLAVADYLVLNPADENSELRKITTAGITGNQITFSANLLLTHRNHERVIKLFGNKIQVYRAANVDGTPPANSAFSTLGSAVAIDADQPFSYYTDSAGGAGYWYKFTYLNDVTSSETDISLSEAVRGGGYGHYVSLANIRAEAGINSAKSLNEMELSQRRDEGEAEVKGALASAGYTLPLQTQSGTYYTPSLITGVARLLCAGLVLGQNFGTTKPSSAKDGKSKYDAAWVTLKKIQDNKIILLDSNEQPLAKPTLVDGWPDETTADVGSDGLTGEPSRISMNKVF